MWRCVVTFAFVASFILSLPSYSQQSVPGTVIQTPPGAENEFTKTEVQIECASHTVLKKLMEAQKFKIIATAPDPLRMVMLNPNGHIIVVIVVDNDHACLLAHFGQGSMISDELQLFLDTFNKPSSPPL